MPTKRTPEQALEAMRDQRDRSRWHELNAHHRRAGAARAGRDPGGLRRRPGARRRSPSSASSRATRRICRAGPSSAPPASCSTARSARPASTRDRVYVTNAVKHFKFEQRGKRRIHAKPTAGEVKHYRSWLMKELDLVRPRLVVALGATARAGADRQGRCRSPARAARRISREPAPATSRSTRPTCCACRTRTTKRAGLRGVRRRSGALRDRG